MNKYGVLRVRKSRNHGIWRFWSLKSAGPLYRGTKAAVVGFLASVFLILNRAQKPADRPHQILNSGFGISSKIVSFSSLFPRPKKSGKRLPRRRKTQKAIPKFFKNGFHEKSVFAILFMRKPRFGSPEHRKLESEIAKQIT